MEHPLKAALDYVVFPLLIAVHFIFQWLPTLALLVPIIYYSISIYESRTFRRTREAWRLRKLAKLKDKILRVRAKIAARELYRFEEKEED